MLYEDFFSITEVSISSNLCVNIFLFVCVALRDLLTFLQFKKVKNTYGANCAKRHIYTTYNEMIFTSVNNFNKDLFVFFYMFLHIFVHSYCIFKYHFALCGL